MRLLLLLEPGLVLALLALTAIHAQSPSGRTAVALFAVLTLALVPLVGALGSRLLAQRA